MKNPTELTIIIVSFNTRALTLDCLASIAKAQTKEDRWEVIVVDNASSDDSLKAIGDLRFKIQDLRIIQNKENVGFAAANNQGIKIAKGTYILLLNSDTEVMPGSIQHVLTYMQSHEDVGAATCKLILPNGRIDPASHRGFPTPWAAFTYFIGLERIFPRFSLFSQYHLWHKDMGSIHEIDSPSGAFFLVRKKILDEVGLLDESYFMYAEDIDWAFRIKAKGWKIVFLPYAHVLHKKKQSGRHAQDKKIRAQTDRHFYATMLQFYDKHMATNYPRIVTMIIRGIIKMRMKIASIDI